MEWVQKHQMYVSLDKQWLISKQGTNWRLFTSTDDEYLYEVEQDFQTAEEAQQWLVTQ